MNIKIKYFFCPQTCSDEKFINKQQFGYEIIFQFTRNSYLHLCCDQRLVSAGFLVLINFKFYSLA